MRNKTTFTESNQAAQKHGGEAALDAIQAGKPLKGLAGQEELAVRAQLEFSGIDSIQEDNAVRIQAVSQLFYNAVLKAVQDGNYDKVVTYGARYGWLASKAVLVWGEILKQRKAKDNGVTAIDVLNAVKAANDANGE